MAAAPSVMPPAQPAQTTDSSTSQPNKLFSEDVLKSYPSLSKFTDANALGKSYAEMEKMRGNSLRLPGADAKPEEWNEVFSKLGRPDKPEGYEFKMPELPEGAGALPEQTVGAFRQLAHQLGLTGKQAQGLLDFVGQDAKAAFEGKAVSAQQNEAALRKEWGGDFDKKISLAQRAFTELADGDKDIVEFMQRTGAHNDPAILKFFSRLGEALEEDTGVQPEGNNEQAAGDALSKINAIRNDKDHPFHSPFKAGHKEALEEMRRLYDIAYPNA